MWKSEHCNRHNLLGILARSLPQSPLCKAQNPPGMFEGDDTSAHIDYTALRIEGLHSHACSESLLYRYLSNTTPCTRNTCIRSPQL